MLSYAVKRIREIDQARLTLAETLKELRKMSLDEFGELLMNLPDGTLPHLSAILPEMAPPEIQKRWTGSTGLTLLRQSISFMNFVAATFCDVKGFPLRHAQVLDFGCGWGRLLRLLAYYNDPEKNFGCDAWAVSLEHSNSCHVGRIAAKLSLSSAVPESLPFEPETFDLVYAFSIFTHLSEVSAKACMQAIRKSLKPGGLAIITVRPIETWDTTKQYTEEQVIHLKREHLAGRVAFIPPAGIEIDKEGNPIHYGDSSMPLETLETVLPGWVIRKAGSTIVDPYQIFVVLEKAEN